MLVQVVFLPTRIRESDIIEGKDWRRQLANVFETEVQRTRCLDFLYETGCLHLINDLLLRFGLLYEVGVGTS